jgi:hypothetical protein
VYDCVPPYPTVCGVAGLKVSPESPDAVTVKVSRFAEKATEQAAVIDPVV